MTERAGASGDEIYCVVEHDRFGIFTVTHGIEWRERN
jgi:hypothetical protein